MLFTRFGLFLSGFFASLSLATETHIQTFDFASPGSSSNYYWKLSTDSALPYAPSYPDSFNDYFDISVNYEGTQASCPGTSLYSLSTQAHQLFTIQSGTPIDYSAAWTLDDTTLYAAASRMEVSYEPMFNDSLFLYQDRQDNFHLCQILKSRRHSACAYMPSTGDTLEYTGFDSLTVSCESALDSSPRFKEPPPLAIWSPDARKARRPLYLPHGEIRLPADEQVLSLIDPSGAAIPYSMKKYADQSQSVIPLASGNRILWLVASRQGQARLYRIAPPAQTR